MQSMHMHAKYHSTYYVGSTAILGIADPSLVKNMYIDNIWVADNTYIWLIISTGHCWHS